MANEVATTDPKGNAVAVYDYGADAGAGFEGTSIGDFKPSFIRVLQGLSPLVSDGFPGAKPGILHDNITNDLYTDILFVPAVREHVYVAWKPRDEGGGGGEGFGGVYQLSDPMVVKQLATIKDKFARGDDGKIILPRTPDGEFQLIETVYFHGVQVFEDTGSLIPVSIPLSSTGLPVAQSWFTTLRRQVIPVGQPGAGKPYALYAHLFKLGSAKQTRGNKTWFTLTTTWAKGSAAESRLDPTGDIYQAAKSVAVAFKEGKADVDYAKTGGSEAGASTAQGGKQKSASDADIPF